MTSNGGSGNAEPTHRTPGMTVMTVMTPMRYSAPAKELLPPRSIDRAIAKQATLSRRFSGDVFAALAVEQVEDCNAGAASGMCADLWRHGFAPLRVLWLHLGLNPEDMSLSHRSAFAASEEYRSDHGSLPCQATL